MKIHNQEKKFSTMYVVDFTVFLYLFAFNTQFKKDANSANLKSIVDRLIDFDLGNRSVIESSQSILIFFTNNNKVEAKLICNSL